MTEDYVRMMARFDRRMSIKRAIKVGFWIVVAVAAVYLVLQ